MRPTRPSPAGCGEIADTRTHATINEVPAERLVIERAKLLSLPPPYVGRSVRGLTVTTRKPIVGYQHPLSVYEDLDAERRGMSDLQHERITALAQDLKLGSLPDLYGPIARMPAERKDASYAGLLLEEVLKAEREARRVRAREMLTRTAGGFPAIKTLAAFDFAFAAGAPRPADPGAGVAKLYGG